MKKQKLLHYALRAGNFSSYSKSSTATAVGTHKAKEKLSMRTSLAPLTTKRTTGARREYYR
jgi:hypothetical protein